MDTTDHVEKINDEILVVDDTPVDSEFLVDILSKVGYRVRSASSGELALRSVQTGLPALILLDFKMPVMDGYEVCRRLKADEKTCSVPVIFITVLEDKGEIAKGFQAGGVDCITKPFHEEEVLARIETHLILQRAKETLSRSELRYRRLFEAAKDGILILNADSGEIADVNPYLVGMLGYPPDEIIGKKLWEISPFKDVAANRSTFERLQHIGYVRYEYLPLETKNGQSMQVEFVSNVYTEGDQQVIQCNIRDVTARRRMEEAQRESEERYRDLVENSHELIYTHDLHGRLLSANHTASQLLGYLPASLVGRSLREMLAPEERGQFEEYLDLLCQRGLASGLWVLQTSTGERRIMKYTSIVRTDAKRGSYVRGMAHNITEQVQAEQSFRSLFRRQEALLAAVPEIVVEVDNNRVYQWTNQAGYEFFGEEVIGKEAAFYFEGEQATYQIIQPLFSGDESTIYLESWQRRKDGQKRLLAWWCRVLKDGTGNVTGALSSARDITERKQAEETLANERNLLRTLIDSIPDYIYVKDANSRIILDNVADAHLMGAGSPEEAVGKTDFDFFPPELAERYYADEQAVFQSGQPLINREEPTVDAAGRPGWVLTTKVPLRNSQGRVTGLVGIGRDISNLKQTEQSLRESELKFRSLVEQAAEMIYFHALDGQILDVNQSAVARTGYTRQELLTMKAFDIDPDYVEREDIGSFWERIKPGEPFMFEGRHRTKKGEIFSVEVSLSKVLLSGDTCILALARDITERKQAEAQIRASGEQYRLLFENVPDGVYRTTPDGKFMAVNPAFVKMFGLESEDELNNIYAYDLYFDPKERIEFIDRARKGEVRNMEVMIKRKDGQPMIVLDNSRAFRDESGTILYLEGTLTDITERKQAENALRAANLEIEQLIASLSSILIAISDDLRITRWNKMAQKIIGISSEEAVGKSLPTINVTWEWDMIASGIDRCRREYHPIYLDPLRFTRMNGSEGFLGINISPIFGGEHTLTGFIILGADITEKIIFESRLAQAQKLESIGLLAAGIAHEINTPIQYIGDNTYFLQQSFATLLSAIQKYEELLAAVKRGEMPPELIEEVQTAVQASEINYLNEEVPLAITQTLEGIQHVTEIVRAMKGFSHPGIKKKTPANINKALQDTITVARNEWKYVTTVETDFDPDLPDVVCLPGEMNQVFLNIIVNAADAIADVVGDGSRGKGKITVGTRQEKDWVEIRISDTGSGIPEEIRGRIFEPFFTTKVVGKGSGQGLAIAYDIVVRKHDGTLTFDTKMGKGTTFIIRLPMIPILESENTHNGDGSKDLPG